MFWRGCGAHRSVLTSVFFWRLPGPSEVSACFIGLQWHPFFSWCNPLLPPDRDQHPFSHPPRPPPPRKWADWCLPSWSGPQSPVFYHLFLELIWYPVIPSVPLLVNVRVSTIFPGSPPFIVTYYQLPSPPLPLCFYFTLTRFVRSSSGAAKFLFFSPNYLPFFSFFLLLLPLCPLYVVFLNLFHIVLFSDLSHWPLPVP